MRIVTTILLSTLLFGTAATATRADDWTAIRLRGAVVQLVGGAWQPVHRDDVVPDETLVRTLGNGFVDFTRGAETVSMNPNTEIKIFDNGGAKPFTTVQQSFGQVSVEAEVQNVQHFAVDTPYLAAVVKGTRFTVSSGAKGASVSVQRGHVEVDDPSNHTHVTITVGQSANTGTSTSGKLEVSGQGDLPVVLSADGLPEAVTDLDATAAQLEAAAEAAQALAKELGTPEAKAAADAAQKAADDAKKAADQADKQASSDAKKAADDAKKAQQDADKAAADDAKAAEKAAKDDGKDKGGNGPSDTAVTPPDPPKAPDDSGKGKGKGKG